MKAFYYLKTCNTCQRILETLQLPDTVVIREIKSQPITEAELQQIHLRTGSYEALFSKRARLYQERGLKTKPYQTQILRTCCWNTTPFLNGLS